jgi:hypothetical protein
MAVLATSNTARIEHHYGLELNTRIRACSHIGTWQAMLNRIESFTCWKLGMTLELLPTEEGRRTISNHPFKKSPCLWDLVLTL